MESMPILRGKFTENVTVKLSKKARFKLQKLILKDIQGYLYVVYFYLSCTTFMCFPKQIKLHWEDK